MTKNKTINIIPENNGLFDVSELIDERFGTPGTQSRIEAEKKAQALLEEEEDTARKSGSKLRNYDEVLGAKYGALGTPSRIEAEEKASIFYMEQL